MPQVGNQRFPYTPEGKAAAKTAAGKGAPPFNKFKKKKGKGRLSAFMKDMPVMPKGKK